MAIPLLFHWYVRHAYYSGRALLKLTETWKGTSGSKGSWPTYHFGTHHDFLSTLVSGFRSFAPLNATRGL